MIGRAEISARLEEALEWLDGHVNLEAIETGRADATPTLERMRRLTELMGDPQRAYPVVHLTGTNGKGSTARVLTSLLGARGLRVGTYISPHLERINERLTADGEPIADDELADLLAAVAALEPLLERPPTWFEIVTAAAFRWFADIAVDVAVIEVGLGGTWDATNVADAQVAVVTNVSLDHVGILGPTLGDIAAEKAGIVKPDSVLVLGETDPALAAVFTRAAAAEVWERGSAFACESNRLAHGGRLLDLRTIGGRYPDVFLPLHGAHQGDNAAVALAAAEAFFGAPLPDELVRSALSAVRNPGRMEVVGRRPLCLLDGAHNPAGARAAGATLAEEFAGADRRVVVLGLLGGRDPVEMLEALDPSHIVLVVACPPPSPRALPPAEVASAAAQMGLAVEVASSVADGVALARARAGPEEMLLVTGSLYTVGAARSVLLEDGSGH
ncbi:MAG TPA: Mur ligase family protein [Acidimicrobiales bacterium]